LIPAIGSQASEIPPLIDSASEQRAAFENEATRRSGRRIRDGLPEVARPYAEHDPASYLLFSGDLGPSAEIKPTLLKELPKDVTAVIYTSNEAELPSLRLSYSRYIERGRLKIIYLQNGGRSNFWSRDGLPVPVLLKQGPDALGLVDAKYYYNFEPDAQLGRKFGAPVLPHAFYHEGGNFAADSKGNCFIVRNSRSNSIPDEIFTKLYGCKALKRLEFSRGIGHVDERVRILNDSVVLTDTEQYRAIFEELGYRVELLPISPGGTYRSYANSLLINGTIFVPIFGTETDEQALSVYRKQGLKVVPIRSEALANNMGVIHCITMTYPKADFQELLRQLGGTDRTLR
jgi:hypothetical protein